MWPGSPLDHFDNAHRRVVMQGLLLGSAHDCFRYIPACREPWVENDLFDPGKLSSRWAPNCSLRPSV
jgi:hypothetical protein